MLNKTEFSICSARSTIESATCYRFFLLEVVSADVQNDLILRKLQVRFKIIFIAFEPENDFTTTRWPTAISNCCFETQSTIWILTVNMSKIPQIQKKVLTQNSTHFLIHISKLLNPTQSVSNSVNLAQSEVGSWKLDTLGSRGYILAHGWRSHAMGFWRYSNGTRSLTHSLTRFSLPLPPLLSITFIPSALYAYVCYILEGTSKAYIFPDT